MLPGEKLGAWLDRHGVKQEDFAEQVGVNQGRISKLIANKAHPSVRLAHEIQRVTGIRWTAWFESQRKAS